MQQLKANTAVDVLIGPFVASTDGVTAEAGLTLSQADIKLSKNGQTLAQKSDVTAAAADGTDGYYNCELDATDTNTEGTLVLVVNETGALPVRHEFMVMAEAAYDSLYVAKDTGFMDVNVKAVSEDTTAADNCEAFFDGTGYAGTNNVIPSVTLTDTVTTYTGNTVQTGDVATLITTVGTAGDGLTAINLPNQTMDITGNLSGSVGSVTGAVGSVAGNVDGLVTGTVAGVTPATAANVNTEVSDVLKTDTIAEQAQGVPPTTPTFEEAVMFLYMALTKRIDVDATEKTFYNNAGTKVWKKTLSDDATTYSETKGASGA